MRIGSLCSGYEGLGMGVQAVLGGELAWVADNDPGAIAILEHRVPSVPNLGDIAAVDWSAVEPVNLICAGFPCQDVSCAGGRRGLREGTRTGVWSHVALAIDTLRPQLVVIENVRGLLSAGADSPVEWCPGCMGEVDRDHLLRASGAVFGDLADLGFDADGIVVSASDAGAPHRRERVFILAWPVGGVRGRPSADPGRHPRAQDDPDGTAATRDRGPTADTEREPVRVCARGLSAAPGAAERPRAQRERLWADHGDGGGPAEDPHRPASSERRFPGPGQTPGGGPRADASGSGGARVAPDADCWRHQGDPELDIQTALGSQSRALGDDTDRRLASNANSASRGRHKPGRGPGPLQGAAIVEWAPEQPGRLHSGSGDTSPVAWGAYEPAIRRWESVLGRPAPRPTEPGRTGERLSPRFVEWMQGLPEGWVTDVPGISRNQMLKALGNGCVPQQVELALRLLLGATEHAA